MSTLNGNHTPLITPTDEADPQQPSHFRPVDVAPQPAAPDTTAKRLLPFATRPNTAASAQERKKMLLVGGILVGAVLLFLFAQFQPRPKKKTTAPQQSTAQASPAEADKRQSSLTPMMDPILRKADQNGDRLTPKDIERMRKPGDASAASSAGVAGAPYGAKTMPGTPGKPLGAVPPFQATQQKWEEPAPYNPNGSPAVALAAQQEQPKDAAGAQTPSLVYVREALHAGTASGSAREGLAEIPTLRLKEGTRIQARLETQISTSIHVPVVAVVDNTYAIGDRVLVPAGARIYGKLAQADASGDVGVEFDQIELADGTREAVSAVGTGLDLGPIKGDVYGKHNGRTFLVRALSGMGSAATMLIGTNMSGAYSPSDQIRERAAENIGTASNDQVMQLDQNTHISVSVPANTKIYVIWTEHRKPTEQKPTEQQEHTRASLQ